MEVKEVLKKRKQCRKKFLHYFKKGFSDPKYYDWERGYKWNAHELWNSQLNRQKFSRLLKEEKYIEIADIAVRIETKTNLLFSFEKMALRDAVKSHEGAKSFARGLFNYIYGKGSKKKRFEAFTEILAALPRIQTRVLTWPLQTVFGFIADPQNHIFMKPKVTKAAAEKYGFELEYISRPNWETYKNLLEFSEQISNDIKDLHPKDMMDLQSFIWVMGSDEYPD
ncbi:MAG: hypothetical protein K0S44_3271 [Bacteroidetes bacterium]|jgi:hypothetical protein|nr:hypothetical protein [Bacteroidota bacterium]